MNNLKIFVQKAFKSFKTREFITAVVVVMSVGLIAHAYRFFRMDLNYDYLAEYYASNGNVIYHRIELGRFVSPLLYIIRGRISSPWLVGLFGFPYLVLSVYLTCLFFERKKSLDIIIIGSFMTVNLTLTVLISTFLHDFDADMMALLFAVCAALVWKKSSKIYHYLFMIPLLVLSMGLYQSYTAVCFSLIFVFTMIQFLNNGFNKISFGKLICGFISITISMFLYYGLANIICALTNIPLESRMKVLELFTNGFLNNLLLTYKDWFNTLFVIGSVYGKTFNVVLSVLILVPSLTLFVFMIANREIDVATKVVICAMMLLLPFATNYTEFLSGAYYSVVMFYPSTALVLPFLYLFLTNYKIMNLNAHTGLNIVLSKLIVFFLIVQVVVSSITSNIIYAKKDTEASSTFAYMNRVVCAIETHDDYAPGKTPVAIFGGHKILGLQNGYENISYISGARTQSSLGSTYKCYYEAYFEYVIKTNINIVDDETFKELAKSKTINEMPVYPNPSAITFVDSILVVKLGDDFF